MLYLNYGARACMQYLANTDPRMSPFFGRQSIISYSFKLSRVPCQLARSKVDLKSGTTIHSIVLGFEVGALMNELLTTN